MTQITPIFPIMYGKFRCYINSSDQQFRGCGSYRKWIVRWMCDYLRVRVVRCSQGSTVWMRSKQCYVKSFMERVFGSKIRSVRCKQEWRVVVRVRAVALQTRNYDVYKVKEILRWGFDGTSVRLKNAKGVVQTGMTNYGTCAGGCVIDKEWRCG